MIRPIGIQTVLILLITMALPINAEPIEVVDDWVQEALTNNATLGAQTISRRNGRSQSGGLRHLGRPCYQVWPGSLKL